MSKEPLKTFQCPSCGAPLEAKEGARTIKCKYCGMTINIPQEPRPIESLTQNHDSEMRRKNVEEGDGKTPPTDSEEKQKEKLFIVLFIAVIFFLFFFAFSKKSQTSSYSSVPTIGFYPVPTKTAVPPGFAKHILTFGSEGIVPGKFTNAAALTVADNGNVIVTDRNSGRFNIFDADGNFISMGSTGKDVPIASIAVRANNQILLVHNFEIHIYDTEGKETGVMEDQLFGDAVIGPDGLLYTLTITDNTISRYGKDSTIELQIEKPFETFASVSEMRSHLAVDGLGNMYLLGENSSLVLKFSPDGVFLDQFGGVGRTDVILKTPVGDSPFGGVIFPTQQPGTFQWPQTIAVDDYGRIYVGDTNGVNVFNANNQYIGSFKLQSGRVCNSLAFDRENHLYVLTDENTVEKYEVPKP
jgi:LSD1 subclass zinc finger protein